MNVKVVLLIIGFVCFNGDTLIGQDKPEYSVENIDKSLTSKAHAVIRKDEARIILESSNEHTDYYTRVISIMSKKGVGFSNFREFYKEGTSKIKDIEIRIYDENGKIIREVKSRDIEDQIAYDGASMISDTRLKLFNYEPVSYPVTIETSWKEESNNTLQLPRWWPLAGPNISVEHAQFSLVNRTDIPIRVSERNIEKFDIKKVSEYVYEMRNQPVIFDESYSPSIYNKYPVVFLTPESFEYEGRPGSVQNWNEFGAWVYHSLIADKADLDHNISRQDLAVILKDIKDKKEIVKAIYDYVQENTRYIFIGLDEGGLVPLSAQKVHDVKYGDCKALSFYMKSLLEAYDIEANYVIVRAGSQMPEDIFENYAAVAPANHVIVNVPMGPDTIWLDCTSHNNPFNYLGSFTDDRLALQVSDIGGKLVRTPVYDKEQNKNEIMGRVHFSDLGDIKVNIDIVDYGLRYNQGIYLKNMDQKEFEEYFMTSLFSQFDKLEMHEHSLDIDEELIKSSQHYNFSASKYGEIAGDYMLFKSSFLPFSIPRLKKDSNRENDIYFPRSKKYTSTLTYDLPKGYRWNIPEDIILKSAYGYYSQTVTESDIGSYEVQRVFELNKGNYGPDQYDDIKRFFDKIRKSERTKFSISNKS